MCVYVQINKHSFESFMCLDHKLADAQAAMIINMIAHKPAACTGCYGY